MDELTRIANRLTRRHVGMAAKNRDRLKQVASPAALRRLLRYPPTEMQKLAREPHPTRKDAVRYSVLLAMEILIISPMRMKNVAELDLDQHFVWPERGRGDTGLAIDQSKNDQQLDYKITAGSAPLLQTYLHRFRPLLSKTRSSALFPGREDRPKRSNTLSKQITKLLLADLGIVWHPHLFRHLAARINLEANLGDYEGTRRLLGHRSAETTYRIYEGMEMRPAVDRYDALIESTAGPPAVAARNRRRDVKSDRPRL